MPYLFEERRERDYRKEYEAASGQKANPDNVIVFIEDTGDPRDLATQRRNYSTVGYDQVFADDSGIYMESPRDNVKAYAKHCQDRSRDTIFRLEDVPAPGDSSVSLGEPLTKDEVANQFLVGGDDT